MLLPFCLPTTWSKYVTLHTSYFSSLVHPDCVNCWTDTEVFHLHIHFFYWKPEMGKLLESHDLGTASIIMLSTPKHRGGEGGESLLLHQCLIQMKIWEGEFIPLSLGRATPDKASRTELFPEFWSPITAIAGNIRSFPIPSILRLSTRSMQGRIFLTYWLFKVCSAACWS